MTLAASETRDSAAVDFDLTPPGPVRRLVDAVWRAIEKRRRRTLLQGMPDYLLKDIGISRCDIDGIVDALVEGRDDPMRSPRRRRPGDHEFWRQ